MSCVYIFTWRHIWSFKRCLDRMYDLNVTMQHLGSLRIISSNNSLESDGLSEIRWEYDCQHHHNGGNLTCGIRFYQDFGMFNSLRNTLTDSRSNMSLSLCLLVMLMKQHLDMYTYKVKTQQRRR